MERTKGPAKKINKILKFLGKILMFLPPIILVGILVFSGLKVYKFFRPDIVTHSSNNIAKMVELEQKPEEYKQDKEGRTITIKEYLPYPDIESAKLLYQDSLDSISNLLELEKKKRVESNLQVNYYREQVIALKSYVDSVGNVMISYKDPWTFLEGNLSDLSNTKLRITDSLNFSTVKESYFFGLKEKAYVYARTSNPHAKLKNIQLYKVPELKNNYSRIGVGFGVGPGVTISGNKYSMQWFTVNFGLQYRF